jgi:hypothetical protein
MAVLTGFLSSASLIAASVLKIKLEENTMMSRSGKPVLFGQLVTKKFINASAILSLVLVSTGALASNLSILNFKVIRDGGGQFEAIVAINEHHGVQVQTTSCGFRELTVDEQKLTRTTLVGDVEADALAILRNEAVLASDESIADPELATGTWATLSVSYQYADRSGERKVITKEIKAPIVIINSKRSDVYANIESIARTVAEAVCQ